MQTKKPRWISFLAVFFAGVLLGAVNDVEAQSVESFYGNRPLTIIVGASPGGGYDIYARLVGRHIGKHIPGNPNVIIQNMPGAGSLKAANHLANVAPKDGSVITIFLRGIPMEPLFGNANARFDPLKLSWIGSPTQEASVLFSWHTTPFKSLDDVRNQEMVVGATGTGADTATFPLVLNEVLGTRIKVVTGYPGAAEALLAMERGESDGIVASWSTVKVPRADWIRDRKVNLLLQLNLEMHPDLADVPMAVDRIESEDDRELYKFFMARMVSAYPFAGPSEVPTERVQALREAFDAAMKDPELLADAKRQNMEIQPVSGATMLTLLEQVYASPKEVVDRARRIIERGR